MELENSTAHQSPITLLARLLKLKNHNISEVSVQLVKYSATGVFLTSLYSALYLLSLSLGVELYTSHFAAYFVSIVVGFFLNRHWSFRNFGNRDRYAVSGLRFGIVSLTGLALNTFFVWFMTGPIMSLPNWSPLVPIFCITPFVTFVLNRKWTFA